MKRFARLLEIPIYAAVGLLESLWHATARYAVLGDIGRLPDEEIAEAVGWDPSTAERLVQAILDARWLERHTDPNVRLLIHDWAEHADNPCPLGW